MRKKIAGLVLGLALLAAPALYAADYEFDKAHSHVGFSVRHILSNVVGEFTDYTGGFSFDEKKPEASKVDVTIQAASINTGNEKRDGHLKTADFFEVDKFPTLAFKSSKVTSAGGNKYTVAGDLTMHGVTKPVILDVQYLGADNMMGSKIVGFSATTKIDRRDFGLTWSKTLESGNLMVGNDVTISLDIAGMEKGAMDKMKKGGKKK